MAAKDFSPRCRSCGAPLTHVFADLGRQPASNAFLRNDQNADPEIFMPLKAFVCESCWLVQLQDFHRPEQLFTSDYVYFSSFSAGWLRHAEDYAAAIIERLELGASSQVIEIASNDGYLLKNFKVRSIPALGIEPAANVADAAERDHGIESVREFFGAELAKRLHAQGRAADLMIANNVLAHVPDINDFIAGFAELLAPGGMATFEFPHLLNLIRLVQFDTIYHEHYSYLSLIAVEALLGRHGLKVVDVEPLPTHGGSLRLFVRHVGHVEAGTTRLAQVRREEAEAGLGAIATYTGFDRRIHAVKRSLLRFLIDADEAGASVVGYGAPAKGNTLLNYCGVRTDFLAYTVDRNPAKQGMLLPGTGIPVAPPGRIFDTKPDYVLILPWNLSDEIMAEMAGIRAWGGRFVVAIPDLRVLP